MSKIFDIKKSKIIFSALKISKKIAGVTLLTIFLLCSKAIHAQGYLFYSDSINFGCFNTTDTLNLAYINWFADSSSYHSGDLLDISIDWGDGNIENYLNLPIINSSFLFDCIDTIYTQHIYNSVGTYYITVTSTDDYLNSIVVQDSTTITYYCGHIYGELRLDDGDGIFESTDLPAVGAPILLNTSLVSSVTPVSMQSQFWFQNINVTANSYNIQIDPSWLAATGATILQPSLGSYAFSAPPVNSFDYKFLLDCPNSYADEYPWGWSGCFNSVYNYGTIHVCFNSFSCNGTPANIDFNMSFDPILTVSWSTLPSASVWGNTISSTITGVNGINTNEYYIYFSIQPGTPPLTPLTFNINTNVTNYTDALPANNQYTIHSMVTNAWDPNYKNTDQDEVIDANLDEEIYYNVHFQNLGNGDANNIIIVDTIDSQFDLNSFRLIAQSHPCNYAIDMASRKITFTFPNIMLPPQSMSDSLSQGYVRYAITENPGLPIGSVLNNTAYIYFDTNPAVVTNTTTNINTLLGIEDENNISNLAVYPQPTGENFYIGGINADDVKTISIVDANGKMMMKATNAKINEGIYVGNLANGMYFVSVETNQTTTTKKLIVQH